MIENLDHEHCYCKILINKNIESLSDIESTVAFHVIPHLRICLVSKICNPKSIFTVLLRPFVDMCRAKKNLSCLNARIPSPGRQEPNKGMLRLLSQLSNVNKRPFQGLSGPRFSHFHASYKCLWCLKWPPSTVLSPIVCS